MNPLTLPPAVAGDRIWKARRFNLPLRPSQPLIMGIVNATPDSFSDGGQNISAVSAIRHAERMLRDGAHILDVGGESTRPGATPVPEEEEWQRIEPVLAQLVKWYVPLSVDTMKPGIMRRALELGVDILNDVNAFRAPGAAELLASCEAGALVMHMQGEPQSMQVKPEYEDVVREVGAFLQNRIAELVAMGVAPNRLMVDPGFGFGKTLEHNLSLLRATAEFAKLGQGVLVGVSRKKMIGDMTGGLEPRQRVVGSVVAACLAAQQGAAVLRVHDVAETVQGLEVVRAFSAV